jgi:UDP-N-acetylmuramate: L-alanyl-gamma-D-glutamyl-meso-diaminopimelate ligase
MAAAAEGFGVAVSKARTAMAQFDGVKRRQDLVASPDGVSLYDDFAHHPTAVDETLRALRSKHRAGKLFAVFEPRSATACRSVHQAQYVTAFGAADRVIFAPLGRSNIPEAERLDTAKLAQDIGERAKATASVDEIIELLVAETRPGDVVALLSNGAFGGIYQKLTARLADRGH